jgi:hypothetical protein
MPGQWTLNVQRAVRGFAAAGIQIGDATPLFDFCEHVTVKATGLAGIAVIHQRTADEPIRFCVFEPSDRAAGGLVEVFERTMASLDELPARVNEWRSFRSATARLNNANVVEDQSKWLRAVATEKKSRLESIRESARLRAAGDIAASWEAAGFDFMHTPPPDAPPLACQRLPADINAVAPDLLAWHFPRDDKGKWPANRRLPLFRYDVDKRRMSAFCLLVATPLKRSGRPVLRAEWLQADLQTARLDTIPEVFDTRCANHFAPELLGLQPCDAHRFWSGESSLDIPPVECLRLQYTGQFEQAAKLAGLELDETILNCMQGRRVAHMCTCCAPLDQQLIEWSAVMTRTLTTLNLPRLAALARRDEERSHHKPRREPIPLIPFPLQRHVRKAHVALVLRDGSKPRLTIDTTGSGNRLPLSVWQRPCDVDLLRTGLLNEKDLPDAVASQFAIAIREVATSDCFRFC